MIIECFTCESKVDGKILFEHDATKPDEDPCKKLLLECPVCKNIILVSQEFGPSEEGWEYEDAKRLWPEPERDYHYALPVIVKFSLQEAEKCYKGKAYSACAVMCGRTLEGICSEYETKNKALAGGLKELLEREIIDKKIYQWGEELRKHRNMGAHASPEFISISRDDAKDLLDFAIAICDYVFVLTCKFSEFMERKGKIKKSKAKN